MAVSDGTPNGPRCATGGQGWWGLPIDHSVPLRSLTEGHFLIENPDTDDGICAFRSAVEH